MTQATLCHVIRTKLCYWPVDFTFQKVPGLLKLHTAITHQVGEIQCTARLQCLLHAPFLYHIFVCLHVLKTTPLVPNSSSFSQLYIFTGGSHVTEKVCPFHTLYFSQFSFKLFSSDPHHGMLWKMSLLHICVWASWLPWLSELYHHPRGRYPQTSLTT